MRAAIGEPLPISVPTFTPSGDELEAVRHLTRFVDAWKAEGLRAIPRFYGNQDGPVPADWATEDFSNRTGPYLKALLQNWSRIEVVDAGIDNTTFPPRMVLTVRAFGASGSGAIHPVTLVKSRSGQWLIENIAQARRP